MAVRKYWPCEWCGALTSGRDEHGEPACALGTGCATEAAPRSGARGRRWTTNERSTLLALFATAPRDVIERRLGRSWKAICAGARRLGISRRRSIRCAVNAKLLRTLGITEEAFWARVRRRGFEGAIAMGPKRASRAGRRPIRGASINVIASMFDLTRQALYKAARLAGRTVDEEIHRRLAKQRSDRRAA